MVFLRHFCHGPGELASTAAFSRDSHTLNEWSQAETHVGITRNAHSGHLMGKPEAMFPQDV